MFKSRLILIFGDLLNLVILTRIGFGAHGELDISFVPRFLATYLPLAFAWLLVAAAIGLFHQPILIDRRQLWRVPAAMLLSAPLAGVFRGWVLNEPVLPIFLLVLTSISALWMLMWRTIYYWLGVKFT